jgi:ABC-type multidrug transport system fused ATPase/permease subunit
MFIMLKTKPMFGNVFRRYDDLDSPVHENVTAIRVVKAFVREVHESGKFEKAANELHDLFVAAESLLAWNNPVMMCAIYGCIISLSWFGTHSILAGQITTGQLTSLLGYVFNVLISLMMLTMIFVMVSMSAASGKRIVEVLEEVKKPISIASFGYIELESEDFVEFGCRVCLFVLLEHYDISPELKYCLNEDGKYAILNLEYSNAIRSLLRGLPIPYEEGDIFYSFNVLKKEVRSEIGTII